MRPLAKGTFHLIALSLLAFGAIACDGSDNGTAAGDDGPGTTGDTAVVADEGMPPNTPCDGLGDSDCVQVHRGESVFYRRPSHFESLQVMDRDTPRTVIRLTALIDAEVTDDPVAWRYQFIGVDNYTFGGFATWDQLQQGYMEVGSRRVIWDPTLELPDSWRVKDTWRVVLSPAGSGS